MPYGISTVRPATIGSYTVRRVSSPHGRHFSDLAAFILAGGKSTRMGADKAFVTLDGRTLLARALELARSLTPDVRIVGDPAKFAAFAPVVEDVFRELWAAGRDSRRAALVADGTESYLWLWTFLLCRRRCYST